MQKKLKKLLPPLLGHYLNLLAIISPKAAAKKAYQIFIKVRKGRVGSEQKDFLEQAKLDQPFIAGHQIQAYRWAGTKGPILLVHGWESNTARWCKLIQELIAHQFEVIAFDGPGHGHSSGHNLYVPLYATCTQYFLDTYKPKAAIGHSMGGMTIMYGQYLKQDQHLEKIVTLGSPSEFKLIAEDFQQLLGFNQKVYQALDQFIKNKFGFNIQDFSIHKYVVSNKKKGLLFHDQADPIIPHSQSVLVHQNWKNSQLITTKGLGHSIQQAAVNKQIINFLES